MKNPIENCLEKLEQIIQVNERVILFYEAFKLQSKGLEIGPSLKYLMKQKKRFKNAAEFERTRLILGSNVKTPSNIEIDTPSFAVKKNINSTDEQLLNLISVEQNFIQLYLVITSMLNPEGSVYQRLINHIEETNMSLQLLERNITHQQALLSA